MIKLGIIGGESSHAWQFASVLNGKNKGKIFDDIELLGVYVNDSSDEGKIGIKNIKEYSYSPIITTNYNCFLADADAVMITLRNGAKHLETAKEYIKKGIPVWIDKPITCSKTDIYEMIDMAQKHNCPLTGGSAIPRLPDVKEFREKVSLLDSNISGGHVTAPVNLINKYGGFWFYTQHLVQMMTTTFGNDVVGVRAFRDVNGVTAIYFYNEFCVTARFGAGYSICVYSKNSDLKKEIVLDTNKYFIPELYDFYKVIKTRKSDMSKKDLAAPVLIIEATIEAYKKNRFVSIKIPY